MSDTLNSLVPGAMIYEMKLATLANNLANAGTAGYKGSGVFQLTSLPESDPAGYTQQVTAARLSNQATATLPAGTYTDFSPGPVTTTGNPLDLYIDGKCFFTVKTPAGTRYTRNGKFAINGDEVLVTQQGYPVMGDGGEITVSGSRVDVDSDGNVIVDGAQVGTLKIAAFQDPGKLIKSGGSLFAADGGAAAGTPEEIHIQQGAYEGANIAPVRMMTEMIEVLRGYESYQKVIRTLDAVESKAVNDVGRLR